MTILLFTYPLNGLLMIGMPIGLALFLTRHFKYSWRLVSIGAITFIASQLGHIPFNALLNQLFKNGQLPMPPPGNQLVFFAILWGLSSGIWEELARTIAYRWFAQDARSWGKGLLMGAGHGGMEAILLGLLMLVNFISLAALRGQDASAILTGEQVTPELIAQAQAQLDAYWSLPWTMSLLGAVERLLAIPLHLACSLIVMQAFNRKKARWVFFSIGWHAMANAVVLILNNGIWREVSWRPYAVEGVVGLFALTSLGIIFALRQPEPQLAILPEPSPIVPLVVPPIEFLSEDLEKTRFT